MVNTKYLCDIYILRWQQNTQLACGIASICTANSRTPQGIAVRLNGNLKYLFVECVLVIIDVPPGLVPFTHIVGELHELWHLHAVTVRLVAEQIRIVCVAQVATQTNNVTGKCRKPGAHKHIRVCAHDLVQHS